MKPEEFKQLWITRDNDTWVEFSIDELNKAPITNLTKQFLSIGFPEGAAPCLGFGWRSNNWKFDNIANEYFEGDTSMAHYWMFGSDGSGNPICFDTSKEDLIVLLDHEENFEPIEHLNNNILELAQCLLSYKRFVNIVLTENEDWPSTKAQVLKLEADLKEVNGNIFKESDFWRSEIHLLYSECIK